MRTSRWVFVAILSLFFVLGPAGTVWAQSYDSEEQQFLELINQYRQQNGLDPLLLSSPLSVASERHSEDMGAYGFFSHTTQASSYYPVGANHVVRIAQEGYDYNTYTAENLAYGQTSAQEVFEAWRTSPEHNVNMLGDYAVIGIGLVWTNGTPYWTTDFGAYVDPSASGGSSATSPDAPNTAPETTIAPAPAPAPAPTPTTNGSGQAPEETVDSPAPKVAPAAPKTPTQQTIVEKSAAEQQYARETSREPAVTEDKSASQTQYATQTAAGDQYSQKTPNTAIGVQKQVTSAEAPAPEAQSSAPEAATEAVGEQDTTVNPAEQPETTQAETTQADTAQADVDPSTAQSEGVSVLPDTGGWPLVLVLGGAVLAGFALVAARRVF